MCHGFGLQRHRQAYKDVLPLLEIEYHTTSVF